MGSTLALQPTLAVDLVLGHFECQIDYEVTPGDPDAGWAASVSYDEDGSFADNEGINRLPIDDVRLLAAPSTRGTLAPSLSAIGTPGEPVWILSQNNIPGQLFLGWRAVFEQGVFQAKVGNFYNPSALGSIESSLVSVTGTGTDRGGNFAMWTSSGFGSLEFHFNSSDGIGADDVLGPIPAGSHSHYNWGFTQPGTYQVSFRSQGRLNPQFGGQDTEFVQTLNFVVPHDGVLRGSASWRLGAGGAGQPSAAIYDSELQVDYACDQVLLIAEEGEMRFQQVGAETVALGRVGLSAEADFEFVEQSGVVEVELVKAVGPGAVSLSVIDGEEVFSFGVDGIYRLHLRARKGSGEFGESFVVTTLVGLEADYDYAQWADSFERTHQLPSGALASRTADFDGDGVGNGLEFLLFWHGFDPAVSDGELMPLPRCVDGRAEIEFLRDLHKDDFANTPLELAAAYSPDLVTPWQEWRRLFAEGVPDGFFEDGAERGNETSTIMRRRLVVPDASPERAFFRFEQRARN